MVATISHNQLHTTFAAYQSSSLDLSVTSATEKNGVRTTATDSVQLRSESSLAVSYTGNMRLSGSDEARFGMLRSLVANLLTEQGINTKISVGERTIDLAAVTPEEARELISDDGYFGVEQTSERIFRFAIGIAGGDVNRIDAIRAGIDKGFAEAKRAFGDWLPDISYQTYDAVMEKLDAWVTQSGTSA